MTETTLAGARKPRWEYHLLNRQGHTKKILEGVLTHTGLDVAATERLGGTASLEVTPGVDQIDFLNDQVRFVYDPGIENVQPWSVGVYRVSSPKRDRGYKGSETILCDHLPVIADLHYFNAPPSISKGQNVIDWVVSLLRDIGVTNIAYTPSSETAANDRTFDIKEPALTVINDLLESVAYWALWADPAGVWQVQPWTQPATRPVVWTFEEGEYALHSPAWEEEQDLSGIINRAVCATNGTDDEEAFYGVAENNDPNSPFSIPNRGVIGRSYDVEATSNAAAKALAEVYLSRNQDPYLKVNVEHAILPLKVNDVVQLRRDGELQRFTVQRMSYGSGFDATCKAVWRGVLDYEFYETDGDSL